MITYAIVATDYLGRPLGYGTSRDVLGGAYLQTAIGTRPGVRLARKFNTPADARSYVRGNGRIGAFKGPLDPEDFFAVVALLPRALAEAEREAAADWEREGGRSS